MGILEKRIKEEVKKALPKMQADLMEQQEINIIRNREVMREKMDEIKDELELIIEKKVKEILKK